MTDIYHDLSATRFVDYNIGGYHVLAPHFLVDKHPRSSWEMERFKHMEKNLRPGMTLFDIGAENGSMSAVYAQFVGGGENICLFEPVPQVFPNIKATWSANGLKTPRSTYCGFVSDKSWISDYHDFPTGYRDGWPECAYSGLLLEATKFRYVGEHSHCTDSITLDDFVDNTGIIPDALTMDVEGYEPTVIAGGLNTIRQHRPLIWLSVHVHSPEDGGNNILVSYTGSDRLDEMHGALLDAGYSPEIIAQDHERHVAYTPMGRKR